MRTVLVSLVVALILGVSATLLITRSDDDRPRQDAGAPASPISTALKPAATTQYIPTPGVARFPLPPPIAVRTPLPLSAVRGGLFEDGVFDLPRISTAGWNTYDNAKFGYSFIYPPDWTLQDDDNSDRQAYGAAAYPVQHALVRNPVSDWGDYSDCKGDECICCTSHVLAFSVSVDRPGCHIAGDTVITDSTMLAGHKAVRCVVQEPHDNKSRTVELVFPESAGREFHVELTKGRKGTPFDQAVLEAMLSSFTLR